MPPAPAAHVEAAAPVKLTNRADLRDLLVKAGLARAAAEKAASGGWPELSGEKPATATQADLDAMAAELAAIRAELAAAWVAPMKRAATFRTEP